MPQARKRTAKKTPQKKASTEEKAPAKKNGNGRLKVEYVPLDELEKWPRNPKNHDLDGIERSIKRFGFTAPVIVDEKTGRLVAGHGRQEALSRMRDRGDPPPSHVQVRGKRWMVPVVRGNEFASEAEAEKYLVADNRFVELGGWDAEALLDMIGDLNPPDLEVVGFDSLDLENLSLQIPRPEDPEPEQPDEDLDIIPDLPVKPKSKPGKVYKIGHHRIHCDDCIEVMKALDDVSVDSIVTDPPYGLGFMGKEWDCSVPGRAFAEQAMRILKPGGHVIAFGATRTIHRLTTTLEDAGFEVRDQIGWLQWQGFPKNLDVSKAIDQYLGEERTEVIGQKDSGLDKGTGSSVSFKGSKGRNANGKITVKAPATPSARAWDGWGTALKPAFEPACLVRKPLIGTVAKNVLAHGTGALNIDGCRYAPGDSAWPGPTERLESRVVLPGLASEHTIFNSGLRPTWTYDGSKGRWPANVYCCPKPTSSEKEDGLITAESKPDPSGSGYHSNWPQKKKKNYHPTVKPIRLMRWLVRLVTPPSGLVLEPFAGSGTTILAAHLEGMTCLAVERDPAYCDLSIGRTRAQLKK